MKTARISYFSLLAKVLASSSLLICKNSASIHSLDRINVMRYTGEFS